MHGYLTPEILIHVWLSWVANVDVSNFTQELFEYASTVSRLLRPEQNMLQEHRAVYV